MPPVVMTNDCPMERITRIAAATSIALMLPRLRNVGVRRENTITRATRPMGAAFSAQKLSWRSCGSRADGAVSLRGARAGAMVMRVSVGLGGAGAARRAGRGIAARGRAAGRVRRSPGSAARVTSRGSAR